MDQPYEFVKKSDWGEWIVRDVKTGEEKPISMMRPEGSPIGRDEISGAPLQPSVWKDTSE